MGASRALPHLLASSRSQVYEFEHFTLSTCISILWVRAAWQACPRFLGDGLWTPGGTPRYLLSQRICISPLPSRAEGHRCGAHSSPLVPALAAGITNHPLTCRCPPDLC